QAMGGKFSIGSGDVHRNVRAIPGTDGDVNSVSVAAPEGKHRSLALPSHATMASDHGAVCRWRLDHGVQRSVSLSGRVDGFGSEIVGLESWIPRIGSAGDLRF